MPNNLKKLPNMNSLICKGKENRIFGFIICPNNIKTQHFLDEDNVEFLPLETTWDDIAVKIGLFPSKGQARKQGWHGIIEDGWHEGHVGIHFSKGIVFLNKHSLTLEEWKKQNPEFCS